MFSHEYKSSKEDLIARLNVATMKINNAIKELSSNKLKKVLNYLLCTTSPNDPYQFNNLIKTMDDEIDELKQKLNAQTKWASVFGITFSLSLMLNIKGSSDYHSDRYSFAKPLAFIAAPLSLYELYSIKNIKKEIKKINKIKKLIERSMVDNDKLASLLDHDSLKFREEFYQKHIQADDLAEQKEQKEKNSSKASMVRWNLSKSFFPDLVFGKLPEKLPEIKVGFHK